MTARTARTSRNMNHQRPRKLQITNHQTRSIPQMPPSKTRSPPNVRKIHQKIPTRWYNSPLPHQHQMRKEARSSAQRTPQKGSRSQQMTTTTPKTADPKMKQITLQAPPLTPTGYGAQPVTETLLIRPQEIRYHWGDFALGA